MSINQLPETVLPGSISEKKLNFGLWYIVHRQQLRKALIVFLIVFSVITWGYGIYGFTYYFVSGMNADDLMIREMVKGGVALHDFVLRDAPTPLTFSAPQVLKSADSKYDLLVKAINPNTKRWLDFQYYFMVDGKEVGRTKGFILPGETKYLVAFAVDLPTWPSEVQFTMDDILWQRLNPHDIPNWEQYQNEHLNIDIKDIRFTPSTNSGLSEKVNLNSLDFSAINNSAYSYWLANFTILLLNSNTEIVGASNYGLPELMAGDKRKIKTSWPGQFGLVSQVSIVPDINILDNSVYIKYGTWVQPGSLGNQEQNITPQP